MKGKSPYLVLFIGVFLIVVSGLLFIIFGQTGQSSLMLIPLEKEVPKVAPKINLSELPSLGELAEIYPELAHVLKDNEVGSIYKDFLIVLKEEGEEKAIQKALEWGLLTPDGKNVRVTLLLDTDNHGALISQLEAVGLDVVSAYNDQVNVGIPITLITNQLSTENPGAIFQQLSELEHVISIRLPQTKKINSSDINGEGIEVIGANVWHQNGYTGTGIRIGVLDLGFAGYENILGQELPDQVGFAQFGWFDQEEVHGVACAEIVHEIAPDAALFFAWYDGTDPSFGDAVEWLVNQNVDIITHSAGTPVTSRDGQNFDASVVDDVVADGILWVNSAGNDGEHHYRSQFNDLDKDGLHEFENNEESLPVYNAGYIEVYLVWEDSWSSARQDYDLAVYDLDGNVLGISRDSQDGSYGSYPKEMVKIKTNGDTIYVAVVNKDTTENVVFDIFVLGYDVSIPFGTPQYSVGSPGDARGAFTVGATSWRTDALESYSSQGPTTDERLKPDISAPAGVSGITYGTGGFDGTSASTPHVAGAAALVWQAHPEFSRQQVIDYLLNASLDYGVTGPDTGYGYGRLALPSPDAIPNPSPHPISEVVTPGATDEFPTPTNEGLESKLAPPQTPTRTLEPTATLVIFATPEPVYPQAGNRVGRAALLGVLILGPGCGGTALVLVGFVTLFRTRNSSSGRQPVNTHVDSFKGSDAYQPPSSRVKPSASTPSPRDSHHKEPRSDRVERLERQPEVYTTTPPVKICPICGTSQKVNARFCRKCGSLLYEGEQQRLCPHCGSINKSRSQFCSKCGQPL